MEFNAFKVTLNVELDQYDVSFADNSPSVVSSLFCLEQKSQEHYNGLAFWS